MIFFPFTTFNIYFSWIGGGGLEEGKGKKRERAKKRNVGRGEEMSNPLAPPQVPAVAGREQVSREPGTPSLSPCEKQGPEPWTTIHCLPGCAQAESCSQEQLWDSSPDCPVRDAYLKQCPNHCARCHPHTSVIFLPAKINVGVIQIMGYSAEKSQEKNEKKIQQWSKMQNPWVLEFKKEEKKIH